MLLLTIVAAMPFWLHLRGAWPVSSGTGPLGIKIGNNTVPGVVRLHLEHDAMDFSMYNQNNRSNGVGRVHIVSAVLVPMERRVVFVASSKMFVKGAIFPLP